MSVDGPGALEIASLRRRGLASLVDLGVFLPPCAIAGVAGFKLYLATGERDHASSSRAMRVWQSRRWQLALWAATVPIDVRLRNSRGPGARALGLRRVDARTAGPVSVRSAVIHSVVERALRELNGLATRPLEQRAAERKELVRAKLAELHRTHPDEDDEARRLATTDLFKIYSIGPGSSCSRALPGLAARYLPALWSARNQTLLDRVAGIVVVRD